MLSRVTKWLRDRLLKADEPDTAEPEPFDTVSFLRSTGLQEVYMMGPGHPQMHSDRVGLWFPEQSFCWHFFIDSLDGFDPQTTTWPRAPFQVWGQVFSLSEFGYLWGIDDEGVCWLAENKDRLLFPVEAEVLLKTLYVEDRDAWERAAKTLGLGVIPLIAFG